ncbi:MAG: class I fructose-bisphosphate aldolase [Armatimonadota bacterium]
MTDVTIDRIAELLADDEHLLEYTCQGVSSDRLHLPGPDFMERVLVDTDRPTQVLCNLRRLWNTGRLAGTGYVSVLPVDQGVEHSAAASFAPNPDYFDPAKIVELAIEGGCNACASTLGVLGSVSRKYAHRIPFIVKLNHSELLEYPNRNDQVFYAAVEQAWGLGAAGVGATIYYGSAESNRQMQEVTEAFRRAHELGMFTVLWTYLRNSEFKRDKDYHLSADLTGQANYLGVTIEADIVKQKQPQNNGGYPAMSQDTSYGRTDERLYNGELIPDNPIEWTRWQVVNCYMGRVGLINSGGASGDDDLAQVVRTAVINKRAGGMGLITGRKAFQRPMAEGAKLLNAVQDVYLCEGVTVA